MNTAFDLNTLTNDELKRLSNELYQAFRRRRDDEGDSIARDARLIAKKLGNEVLNEQLKTANKFDGYFYKNDLYTIAVSPQGNVTIVYQGNEVFNQSERVYLPVGDWIGWIQVAAAGLRNQEAERKAAEERKELLTSIENSLNGSEFTNPVEAVEYFQLGPFAPTQPLLDDETPIERAPSASDIRLQILLAGLASTDDPAVRVATLRLIRKQLDSFYSGDVKVLCSAIVAIITDDKQIIEVRAEAVATAWGWLNWYGEEQVTTSTALLAMMTKGGMDAQIVIHGMALLGDDPNSSNDE